MNTTTSRIAKCNESFLQTFGLLSTGGCKTGLSAAATLDEGCCLAYVLAGILSSGNEVVGIHQHQLGLVSCKERARDGS